MDSLRLCIGLLFRKPLLLHTHYLMLYVRQEFNKESLWFHLRCTAGQSGCNRRTVERCSEGRLELPSIDNFQCQINSFVQITNEACTTQHGDKRLKSLTPDGSSIMRAHQGCSSSATCIQQRSHSGVLSQKKSSPSHLQTSCMLLASRASHMLRQLWSRGDGAQAQVRKLPVGCTAAYPVATQPFSRAFKITVRNGRECPDRRLICSIKTVSLMKFSDFSINKSGCPNHAQFH